MLISDHHSKPMCVPCASWLEPVLSQTETTITEFALKLWECWVLCIACLWPHLHCLFWAHDACEKAGRTLRFDSFQSASWLRSLSGDVDEVVLKSWTWNPGSNWMRIHTAVLWLQETISHICLTTQKTWKTPNHTHIWGPKRVPFVQQKFGNTQPQKKKLLWW